MQGENRAKRIEQEIKRKQSLAMTAKKKGMHTTYGNYMSEIIVLKGRLQKLRTNPSAQI